MQEHKMILRPEIDIFVGVNFLNAAKGLLSTFCSGLLFFPYAPHLFNVNLPCDEPYLHHGKRERREMGTTPNL